MLQYAQHHVRSILLRPAEDAVGEAFLKLFRTQAALRGEVVGRPDPFAVLRHQQGGTRRRGDAAHVVGTIAIAVGVCGVAHQHHLGHAIAVQVHLLVRGYAGW